MTDWPTWRQSPLFPGTESPEFQGALTTLRELMGDLVAFFDDKGIGSSTPPELLQEAMQRYCQVSDALLPVRGELQMRVTTDSRDEAAQSKTSELNRTASTMATLMTRLQRVRAAHPLDLDSDFWHSALLIPPPMGRVRPRYAGSAAASTPEITVAGSLPTCPARTGRILWPGEPAKGLNYGSCTTDHRRGLRPGSEEVGRWEVS